MQNVKVTALHHHRNQGYGAALNTGIQRARNELIFFCDADLQFHLSELGRLLLWIEHYGIASWPRACRAANWLANRLLTATANVLYHSGLTDEATCLKLLPTTRLRERDLRR